MNPVWQLGFHVLESVKEEKQTESVRAHKESNVFWLKTSHQKGGIQTIISVVVFPFSYTKPSLYSGSMEKKQANTILSVEHRLTEGNKNNMNLRLMNSRLERFAQNSFI